MSAYLNIIALMLLTITNYATPSSTGAPTLACNWMRPLHIAPPQRGPSPFFTRPDKKIVEANGSVRLILASTSADRQFKGFMLIAYDESTLEPVGFFSTTSSGQIKSCSDGLPNMVTHSDSDPKSAVKVQWNAPPGFEGNVVFRTTFVENYSTFWVKTSSIPVNILASKIRG